MSKEIDNPVAVLSDYIRGIKGIADEVLDPIEASSQWCERHSTIKKIE